jgi:Leu/Phe-tRNA-protein transferase
MSCITSSPAAFRVDAFDAFLQVYANVVFSVTEFCEEQHPSRGSSAKRRRAASSKDAEDDDPDETPEPPLASPLASYEDPDSGLQRVSLVSLRPNRTFIIHISYCTPHGDDLAPITTVIKGRTTNNCKVVSARSLITDAHFDRLTSSEFMRVIVLHPSEWMICLVDWKQKRQVLLLMSRLYYEALFTISSPRHDFLLSIPNGNPRYGIDFSQSVPGCWAQSRKVRKLLCKGKGAALRVAVNRDFGDTMKRAQAYHDAKGGTWITPALIQAMELMSIAGDSYGVRLCAVELWDASTDTLLAACLGFALGSVYHDFTMFTSVRSSCSFGSLITKVLAAALEDCGYRLWYWGFRVAYMSSFEGSCGAVHWNRDDFYKLWTEYRSELPIWHVETYLKGNRGLLQALDVDAKPRDVK